MRLHILPHYDRARKEAREIIMFFKVVPLSGIIYKPTLSHIGNRIIFSIITVKSERTFSKSTVLYLVIMSTLQDAKCGLYHM
jgi:hypothetical protein